MIKNVLLALFIAALFIAGCAHNQRSVDEMPIYNSTLNGELENLTVPASNVSLDTPFVFKPIGFTPRREAQYDFASDDVFALMGENFDSRKVSVLGIMLGDSSEDVVSRLGVPDVRYTPADKSYSNIEYGRRIGLNSSITGVTYHVDGDVVTRITLRNTFDPYLSGKTKMGTTREEVYALFDVPDYISFIETHRIFNYVEKGLEVYLRPDNVDIISLVPPKEFKGVEYRTVREEVAPGVWGNVTRPFPIE